MFRSRAYHTNVLDETTDRLIDVLSVWMEKANNVPPKWRETHCAEKIIGTLTLRISNSVYT